MLFCLPGCSLGPGSCQGDELKLSRCLSWYQEVEGQVETEQKEVSLRL